MAKIRPNAEKSKLSSEIKPLLRADIAKDFEKNQNPILAQLLKIQRQIIDSAAHDVVKRPALLSRYDARCGEVVPIISQGTINIIQGKTGTHKSRLAELFCSLFLMNKLTCDTDFLEFQNEIGVTVVYIDTERGIKEQFPEAIQRMRVKAGFHKTYEITNFHTHSISKCDRTVRLNAVKEILSYVQSQSKNPLFVVLDVVTDCVSSFNNETESLKLFDTLGNFADDYDATFLILIHENPASEKARGHTGTEGQNKASTIIQIGYNSEEENSDLMKLKFIKTRSSGRPNPIYIQYSKEAHGLVLADAETVKQHTDRKKRNFANDLVIDFLEFLLIEPIEKGEVYKKLEEEFKVSERAATNKVSELIEDSELIFRDSKGRECKLTREKDTKDKRRIFFSLTPIETEVQTEISF